MAGTVELFEGLNAAVDAATFLDEYEDQHPELPHAYFDGLRILSKKLGGRVHHADWNGDWPEQHKPGRPAIPDTLRWLIWQRDNFTCQLCGTRSKLSVDHITPFSKGGTTVEDNLQTLCKRCNSRKGAA